MTTWKEYRCEKCHKLLFKGILIETDLEIKCKHCHELNQIKASQTNEYLCGILPCPNRIPLKKNS